MLSPEHLLRALTAYLGIDYHLYVHQEPNGTPVREHHLFCDGPILQDVLRWVIQYDGPDRVRIFEGDPPPF